MPPAHPSTPAEQQYIDSTRAIMAAGHETARYGTRLVEAALAAMEQSGPHGAYAAPAQS